MKWVTDFTVPLQLLRESVDNYKPGHLIPACQVKLVWSKVEEPPKELSYMIHVTGVIPNDTHIRVTRDAVFHGQQNSMPHTFVWIQTGPLRKRGACRETAMLWQCFYTP